MSCLTTYLHIKIMKNLFVLLVFLFCGTMMTNAQNEIQRPNSYNYTKGIDLAHEGKTSEALECFEKELKDNPKNGYAYSWIGAIYLKMEEYGSALTAIKNSIKYLPAKDEDFVANSYKALCNVYLNVQDTLQAYSTLGEGLRAYRNNGELLETRAQLYFEQCKYEESNIDYQHMIDVNPGDEMGYMGLGRNLKMQKKYSEAIVLFDKVTKLSPNYSSGYAFRAECLFAQKKYEAAIDDVVKALSIDINDRKAMHHLMELSDSVYDDVISHLKVQAIKEKKTVNWYYCLGKVCMHSNYYQEAIGYFENGIKIDAIPILEQRIAECYQKLQDFDNAIVHIDKAYNLDADDMTLLIDKAEILADAFRYSDAIDVISGVIENNSDYDYGYRLRAGYKERMKDYKGAIEDMVIAVILDPNDVSYYAFRGYLFSKVGEKGKSERDYQKILELDSIPNASSIAMYAYQGIGDNKKAIDFMSSIIEKDSTNNGVYYDAACLYGRMGDYTKSLNFLKLALEKGYNDYLHILQDYDMDALRGKKEFQELIEVLQLKNKTSQLTQIEDQREKVAVEIPFSKDNGLCKVKCSINGIELHFIFDTGASVVSLSDVEATFMLKNGYISKTDIIGSSNYMTASGKIEEGTIINIKKLDFGGFTLENIRASVAKNQNAPLLLGQNVLGRLGKIEIDNNNQVLRITQ